MWLAWETLHSGFTVATMDGFNSRNRLPVLSYSPPLNKRQAQLLADALNRGEPWAALELANHLTRRSTV